MTESVKIARGLQEGLTLVQRTGYRLYPKGMAQLHSAPVLVPASLLWFMSRIVPQASRYAEKTAVVGMLERGTRQVRATVIPNVKRETLQKKILEQIGFGSTVDTGGWPGYEGLTAKQFIHETVRTWTSNVRGEVSTQAIENFWSCLKRTLNGTRGS